MSEIPWAVDAHLENKFIAGRPVDAYQYGVRGDGGNYTTQLQAAMTAADTAGVGSYVKLPVGTIGVGAGLKMTGHRCGLVGAGASRNGGTSLVATNQDGPVLDLTGWLMPANFRGKTLFADFAVKGDGTVGADKAGILIPGAYGGLTFRTITTSETGGPGLSLGQCYLSDFVDVVIATPIGAATNNVPFMHLRGANGNKFDHCGLIGYAGNTATGTSAILVEDDGTYVPSSNEFDTLWTEALHLPTGGAVFRVKGKRNIIHDPQFFDTMKVTGATDTAFVRFEPSTIDDHGGNIYRGVVPGRASSGDYPDWGVVVGQSRNRVEGVKGWRGYNVRLTAGVGYTYVHLGGAESTADWPGVVDESGQNTNAYTDEYLRACRSGAWGRDERTAGQGGAGPRFYEASTPANGAVWVGQDGVRFQGVGANGYLTGDIVAFRNRALGATTVVNGSVATGAYWIVQNGSPEGARYGTPGSICSDTTGKLWVKGPVAGSTGWTQLS